MQKIKNSRNGIRTNNSGNQTRYTLFLLIFTTIVVILSFKYNIHNLIIESFRKTTAYTSNISQTASTSSGVQSSSGLRVPRFVSLKDEKVNVRKGPGTEYEVAWVFLKKELPVEITNQFENWRLIRDSEGQEGWVFYTLLSSKRTAIVAPWLKSGQLALYANPYTNSAKVAIIEPGVIGEILSCNNTNCKIKTNNIDGYIEKKYLWGIYSDENIN